MGPDRRQLIKDFEALTDSRRGVSALVVMGVVAGAISVGAMWIGVRSADAFTFVAFTGIGGLFGAFALLVAGRVIGVVTKERSTLFITVLGIIGAVFGGAITLLAVQRPIPWLAAVGLIPIMLALIVWSGRAADRADRRPEIWFFGGLGLMLVGLVTGMRGTGVSFRWELAGGVALIGLTLFKLGLTPLLQGAPERRTKRALIALGASVLGVAAAPVLLLLRPNSGLALVVIGWLLFVSLSTAGLAALQLPTGRWISYVWFAGLIAAAVGVVNLRNLLPQLATIGVVAAVAALMVGAFFVWRGEAIVALVLLGALLTWVLINRSEPSLDSNPGADAALVVFGDSFSAGQGAETYLDNTNSTAANSNSCRRAPTSIARLLARNYGMALYDYACNGAEPHEVRRTEDLDPNDIRVTSDGRSQLGDAMAGPFAIDRAERVGLVLVTVGGNAAEFSTVVRTCLLPSNCADNGGELLSIAAGITSELTETYRAVETQLRFAGVDPHIVVIPYPRYVGVGDCSNGLEQTEMAFTNLFIKQLNEASRAAANEAGSAVHYFDGVDEAYAVHGYCDEEPGANLINLLPPGGGFILDRLNPAGWVEGSAHPNALGHRCVTVTLDRWLRDQDWFAAIADGHDPYAADCAIPDDAEETREAEIEALVEQQKSADPDGGWWDPAPGHFFAKPLDESEPVLAFDYQLCDRPGGEGDCFSINDLLASEERRFVAGLLWRFGFAVLGGMLLALAIVRTWPNAAVLRPLISPDR